jgi:hypothetical protein
MSDPVPGFRASVTNGILVLQAQELFDRHLARYEGKVVEVFVRLFKTQRSLNQNRYYWGVVVAMIAEEAGYSLEEAHEALKFRFLAIHNGSLLPTVRSTTTLNTAEMEEYLESIRRFAAEFYGIVIPLPNEILAESL